MRDAQAVLVLADGTNCRDARSPFPPDERAEGFDELIRSALADVDTKALLELGPEPAARLGVTGRAALQAVAAAVESDGERWDGELPYSDAPFDVGYHVAVWCRSDV